MTPTPTTPNGSVVTPPPGEFGEGSGAPVIVEQGPRWLVELLYFPPDWVSYAVPAVALVVIGLAALGYRRAGGLDAELRRDMISNVTTVGCIYLAALTVREVSPAGYVVDVVLAVVVGAGVAHVLTSKVLAEAESQNG